MGEHLPYKQGVSGSSPLFSTIKIKKIFKLLSLSIFFKNKKLRRNVEISYNVDSGKSFLGKLDLFGVVGSFFQELIRFLIFIIIFFIIFLLEITLGKTEHIISAIISIIGLVLIIRLLSASLKVLCNFIFRPVVTFKQLKEVLRYIKTKEVVINGKYFDI